MVIYLNIFIICIHVDYESMNLMKILHIMTRHGINPFLENVFTVQ